MSASTRRIPLAEAEQLARTIASALSPGCDPLIVCEWWCQDEAGWAIHRLATVDSAEGMRRAVLHIGGSNPFCWGVTEANDPSGPAEAMARQHPHRIVSCSVGTIGCEDWRVRIAADPVWHAAERGRMRWFYGAWDRP